MVVKAQKSITQVVVDVYEGEILCGIKYPRRPPISALKDPIANRSSVVSRFEKGISGGL